MEPHRKSRRAAPRKKPGYQLPEALVRAVKDAVEQGAAESQNAFVERALKRELRETRRRRLYDAYAAAASDPAFLADMDSTTAAWESAAADGLNSDDRG
jgi:Arc/MetJ-type ribon-helix-helix transcriptional regulator